jgi:hypothetical protein
MESAVTPKEFCVLSLQESLLFQFNAKIPSLIKGRERILSLFITDKDEFLSVCNVKFSFRNSNLKTPITDVLTCSFSLVKGTFSRVVSNFYILLFSLQCN